jgi:hypothetical protein
MTEVTLAEVTTIKRVMASSRDAAIGKFDAGEGVVITSVPGDVVYTKSVDIEEVPI